jgi:hypothetical protein
MLKGILLLSLLAALLAGCGAAKTPPPAEGPVIGRDVVKQAAMLKPMDMSQSALEAKLRPWESAVVEKMVQAAALMDQAYWQQVDPVGLAEFTALATATSEPQKSARFMMDANYGHWDRFNDFAAFVGVQVRPAGGYVFPADLTKTELDAYVAAHPDEKARLLDPFTVVRRDGDKLVAVPYHEAYSTYVLPAADLLDEAAALSENASLATYLKLEAEALRTDDYFDANMAWLDLDANLDLSIGPHESYDDQLTGQKAFYKANVLLVDRSAAAKLGKLMAQVPALQRNLPVPARYRPDQTGTMTPLELADDVRRAGQGRAVMEPVAFSLPNDPKVWAAKGSKKVMMTNYLETRRMVVLAPLAQAILDPQAAELLDATSYFNWVLMHEITHTLGPSTVEKDGKRITVGEALGQRYAPIEEGKADIGGLYSIPSLLASGTLTGTLESHYVGCLAEALRSIRFGQGSAYGVIRLACWNFLEEKGALTWDPGQARYVVDVDKMTAAVNELLVTLITIEGEGDLAGANAFIAKYSAIKPELQTLLDKAEATVPIEFVPVYERP